MKWRRLSSDRLLLLRLKDLSAPDGDKVVCDFVRKYNSLRIILIEVDSRKSVGTPYKNNAISFLSANCPNLLSLILWDAIVDDFGLKMIGNYCHCLKRLTL